MPKNLPRANMEFALGYEFIDVLPLIKTGFPTPPFLLFEFQLLNGKEVSGNQPRGQEKVAHMHQGNVSTQNAATNFNPGNDTKSQFLQLLSLRALEMFSPDSGLSANSQLLSSLRENHGVSASFPRHDSSFHLPPVKISWTNHLRHPGLTALT